jgi:hypothetical protein
MLINLSSLLVSELSTWQTSPRKPHTLFKTPTLSSVGEELLSTSLCVSSTKILGNVSALSASSFPTFLSKLSFVAPTL